jgi:hypothetical protein
MTKLAMVVTLALGAARVVLAETFVTEAFIDGVARNLQEKLPRCARFDGLVEARRGSAQWSYAFRPDANKTSATEVRVKATQLNAHSTEVTVEATRIEGGILFDREKRLPAESREWTTRVSAVLDSPPGTHGCADLEDERSK